MALLFCDSFDHYTTNAAFLGKWSAGANNPAPSAVGRNGTNGVALNGSGTWMEKGLANSATIGVGHARKFQALSLVAFLRFFDGGTTQCEVRVTSAGLLTLNNGDGTLLGTSTLTVLSNVFYWIEVKVTIHNTTGAFEVKVNGVTYVSVTGVNTRQSANNVANAVRVVGVGASDAVDDFVIWDTTGSAPTNDFLGDCRVETILPSGNGNSSVLVGSDGNSTDNYLLVDETTPNSDTDYVESSTVGDKDTYVMGNITPTSGTVYGVQVIPYARKTDAGARSIVSVARLSATEVDSAAKTLSTDYAYLPDIREAKPGGGVWTITDVNNAEFGVKVNA